MFRSVSISNFRGIKEISFEELGKINILVGENGIGKSSILDALFVSINPSKPELVFRTNLFRDIKVVSEEFWKVYFYDFNFESPYTKTIFK